MEGGGRSSAGALCRWVPYVPACQLRAPPAPHVHHHSPQRLHSLAGRILPGGSVNWTLVSNFISRFVCCVVFCYVMSRAHEWCGCPPHLKESHPRMLLLASTLAWIVLQREQLKTDKRSSDVHLHFPAPIVLPEIPTPSRPAIVVGMPKAGTSSITDFFKCGGVTSTHYFSKARSILVECVPSVCTQASRTVCHRLLTV